VTSGKSVPKLAWRIGINHWEPDDAFERLQAFLVEHLDIVHEVALFDTITHHLYIPLDLYEARAALLGRRLRALKAAGIPSAGVNVLCTIGHINEGWDYMPPLPFQAMVGHDGSLSKGCACPNTPELREYVRAKYVMVARQHPDFIWVDDDIRMHNHGVAFGCFCQTCLSIFSKETGQEWTREALVAAFDDPARGDVREAWVNHNIKTLESLLAEVADAVHSVAPEVALGLMTAGPGWTTYSGQAFDRWFSALRATKSRPGGGFYSDDTPMEMYHKAIEVGRQRAGLPAAVTDVQYELENFPYQMLRKAPGSVANECTLALAFGMNGIAFNALGMGRKLDEYRPIMERVRVARRMWDQLLPAVDGLATVGLWPAWTARLMARRKVRPGESWLYGDRRYSQTIADVLAGIGLPLSVDPPSCGTVLAGRIAEAFSDDDLCRILAGGVLMDSETLTVLEERGLAHLAGVRVVQRRDNGVTEQFTDDPLNGAAAGDWRDARIEFWGDARGMADVLEPLAEKVRVLAMLRNYFGQIYGPCMTAYENELGGRVVVAGYAPWMFLYSADKREQLLNVADWLTRGALPVRVQEPVRLVPVARLSDDRARGAIVLLHAWLDPVENVTVHVRAPLTQVAMLTADGDLVPLSPKPAEGGWSVTLGPLPAWSVAALLLGPAASCR